MHRAEVSCVMAESEEALPAGWVWANLAQLSSPEKNAITDGPFGSNLKTEHYTTAGPRVIRLQNIGDGRFRDSSAHISDERFQALEKHSIFGGDLAIATLGDILHARLCDSGWHWSGNRESRLHSLSAQCDGRSGRLS